MARKTKYRVYVVRSGGDEDLTLSFKFKSDALNYVTACFASSEKIKVIINEVFEEEEI